VALIVAVAVADGEEADGDGQALGEIADEGVAEGLLLGLGDGERPPMIDSIGLGLALGLADGLDDGDGQASAADADEPPTVMTAGSATTAPAHKAPTAVTAAVRRKRDAM
jgi:hypothetical protein